MARCNRPSEQDVVYEGARGGEGTWVGLAVSKEGAADGFTTVRDQRLSSCCRVSVEAKAVLLSTGDGTFLSSPSLHA